MSGSAPTRPVIGKLVRSTDDLRDRDTSVRRGGIRRLSVDSSYQPIRRDLSSQESCQSQEPSEEEAAGGFRYAISSAVKSLGGKIKAHGKKKRHSRTASILTSMGLLSSDEEEDETILQCFVENSSKSEALTKVVRLSGKSRPSSGGSNPPCSPQSSSTDLKTESLHRRIFIQAIKKSQFFANFAHVSPDDLYERAVKLSLVNNEIIYEQNQAASLMFVLVEGTVRLTRYRRIHLHATTDLYPGDCFCEDALISSMFHENEAMVTSEHATVLAIHRVEFKELNLRASQEKSRQNSTIGIGGIMSLLDRDSLLKQFQEEDRAALESASSMLDLRRNELVTQASQPNDALYYVVAGSVTVYCLVDSDNRIECVRLGEGESFGLCVPLHDEKEGAGHIEIKATSKVNRVCVLKSNDYMDVFDKIHGEQAARAIRLERNLYMSCLVERMPLFAGLEIITVASICEGIETKLFDHDDEVDGRIGVFVVLQGVLLVRDEHHNPVSTLMRGECYGTLDEVLMDRFERQIEESSASWLVYSDKHVVSSCGDCVLGLITSDVLHTILPPASPREAISKAEQRISTTTLLNKQHVIGNPNKADLQLVYRLYSASFSRLYVAKHLPTGLKVAVKEIRRNTKFETLEAHQQTVQNEISILQVLSQTLLTPALYASGISEDGRKPSFLWMEPLDGGDLEQYVKAHGCLDQFDFEYYAATLMQILTYLNEMKIMHRDIKPRNLMLDGNGFLRLIDFGIAKVVNSSESRTFSTCGTPKYFAPEMVQNALGKGSGYTIAVDWWQAGVTLFELAYGYCPFLTKDDVETQKDSVDTSEGVDCKPLVPLIMSNINAYTEAFNEVNPRSEMFTPREDTGKLKRRGSTMESWMTINSFLIGLMNPEPFHRLGIKESGPRMVRHHLLFQSVDWDGIRARHVKPPHYISLENVDEEIPAENHLVKNECNLSNSEESGSSRYYTTARQHSEKTLAGGTNMDKTAFDLWCAKEMVHSEARRRSKMRRFSSVK